MVLRPEKEEKVFGARIPTSLYNRYKQAFPQRGSTVWFIEIGLERFLARLEAQPSLVEVVDQAIDDMLKSNRDLAAQEVEE